MKKVLYIGIPLAIVLVVVFVALVVSLSRTSSRKADQSIGLDDSSKNTQSQVVFPTSTQATKNFDERLKAAYAKDGDLDALLDEEEKKNSTDEKNPDTDGDGLLDGAEVYKFKTNPLKADTDGDGMKDGMEILRGRNPLVNEVVTPTVSPSSTKR